MRRSLHKLTFLLCLQRQPKLSVCYLKANQDACSACVSRHFLICCLSTSDSIDNLRCHRSRTRVQGMRTILLRV